MKIKHAFLVVAIAPILLPLPLIADGVIDAPGPGYRHQAGTELPLGEPTRVKSLPADQPEVVPEEVVDVSTESVAERIVEEEGYQLFRFTPESAQSYELVVRSNGSETIQHIQDLPGGKQCIIAVRFGEKRTLEAVRFYYNKASVSMEFPKDRFPPFMASSSEDVIHLNHPFLTLHDNKDKLEMILRPHKK